MHVEGVTPPQMDSETRSRQHVNRESRYVCRELKAIAIGYYFAASPPLDAVKLLRALVLTDQIPEAKGIVRRQEDMWISIVFTSNAGSQGPAAGRIRTKHSWKT